MTVVRQFDKDLEDLRLDVLRMGGICRDMIHSAVRLVMEREPSLSGKVRRDEDVVNGLHIEIDEKCLRLIALHQPAARDLRLLAAIFKVNADLERIGDQAVNISETGAYLCRLPPIRLGDIPRMAELAQSMLKDALAAFSDLDVELAKSVIRRDDEEDRLKSETFNELVNLMQTDASTIQRAMDIILIARNLERIADHATNIAEDVIFMVLGKDIRHGSEMTLGDLRAQEGPDLRN